MSLRVGLLSTAHPHAGSYVTALRAHARAEIVGVWDDDSARGEAFAGSNGIQWSPDRERLIEGSDAVVICAENRKHLENARAATGRAILCEKPLATTPEEVAGFRALPPGIFMTAFPCRFHPAYAALKRRLPEIGAIRAIAATNRGTCPGGWFVEEAASGGGAMIDHTVHVADLLRDLLGAEPTRVYAQTGSGMYERETDDTAMLTMEFGDRRSGDAPFVTLDASWSRPIGFRTWGDVMMSILGEEGSLELDMFGAGLVVTTKSGMRLDGIGSDADAAMVDAFVRVCLDGESVTTTLEDGLRASEIAIAGYASSLSGLPVSPDDYRVRV